VVTGQRNTELVGCLQDTVCQGMMRQRQAYRFSVPGAVDLMLASTAVCLRVLLQPLLLQSCVLGHRR
jgi:hypothetical protein